jgi:hypothetical protein
VETCDLATVDDPPHCTSIVSEPKTCVLFVDAVQLPVNLVQRDDRHTRPDVWA